MKQIFTAIVAIAYTGLGLFTCADSLAADASSLLSCKAGQVEVFAAYAVQGKAGHTPRNIFVCMAQEAYATEAGIKVLESRLAEREGKPVVVTFFTSVN